MTFTFTVSRPPLAVTFEAGSVGEGAGILQENAAQLLASFASITLPTVADEAAALPGATETDAQRKKREKAEKKAQGGDPATAAAPPIAPVPAAAMAPVAGDPLAIPPGLVRDPATNASPAIPAAAAPPPPPILPAAPPIAPAPPAAGPITEKVVAELIRRGTGPTEQGQLVAWLAGPAIALCVANASFDEAIACIRMQGDVKVSPLLAPLGVA